MKLDFVLEYASEGAPLLIADVASAAHWRGAQDDGKGVTVDYMAAGLPRELMAGKRPGMQQKRFKGLAEAKTFEQALLTKLRALHKRAVPLPPNSNFYYVGDERVFSIELTYCSPFDAMLQKLKGNAQSIAFDKKNSAVFMDQAGGGRGVVVADLAAGVIAIAKLSGKTSASAAAAALAKRSIPSGKTKLQLDGRIVIFDAAYAAFEIAALNWKTDAFDEAAKAAFDKHAHGALRIRDQKLPCAAFVRLVPGKYQLSSADDVELGKATATVSWLRRT